MSLGIFKNTFNTWIFRTMTQAIEGTYTEQFTKIVINDDHTQYTMIRKGTERPLSPLLFII